MSQRVCEMGLGTVVRQSVSHSQTARARIGDRQLLDLDVRRPLSKRGTLEATARQESASGRSPVPL